jgi:hypothetical protein
MDYLGSKRDDQNLVQGIGQFEASFWRTPLTSRSCCWLAWACGLMQPPGHRGVSSVSAAATTYGPSYTYPPRSKVVSISTRGGPRNGWR